MTYTLVLKHGEIEDRVIRGITVKGGGVLKKTLLSNNLPRFIEVKGKVIATSDISQLVKVR